MAGVIDHGMTHQEAGAGDDTGEIRRGGLTPLRGSKCIEPAPPHAPYIRRKTLCKFQRGGLPAAGGIGVTPSDEDALRPGKRRSVIVIHSSQARPFAL
jgi:hypothetical protein